MPPVSGRAVYAPWPGVSLYLGDILGDMNNLGVFPLDPESPVTEFRLLAGDSVATPTGETGEGQFELWSDEDVKLYIRPNPDNVFRGIATAYYALAAQAAVNAQMSKDYDTQLDNTKRSAQLLAVADSFSAKANVLDDELNDNGNHFFTISGHDVGSDDSHGYNWGSRSPRSC